MFARHDLVWLSEAGWRQVREAAVGAVSASALGSVTGPAADPVREYVAKPMTEAVAEAVALSAAEMASHPATAIDAWRHADWPLVVRRADPGQAPGQLALGLALPPRPGDGRKLRIPCCVDAGLVRRHAAPLPLAQAAAALPRWREALAALVEGAAAQEITLRVYGSVALQILTGQTYLTASSDIDVLAQPRDRAQLDVVLALLREHTAGLPLDGELVFPGGRAVAWKEWAAALASAPGARVLVKEMERVTLVSTGVLLATLEEAPCTM